MFAGWRHSCWLCKDCAVVQFVRSRKMATAYCLVWYQPVGAYVCLQFYTCVSLQQEWTNWTKYTGWGERHQHGWMTRTHAWSDSAWSMLVVCGCLPLMCGIISGLNVGVNTIYSGTVAAAMEVRAALLFIESCWVHVLQANMYGIPSIALSIHTGGGTDGEW